VEVVVSLTESDQSRDEVITRAVAVVERLVTEPVSQGVDAECSLLNDEDPEDACVDEATQPVIPTNTSDHGRENEAHEKDNFQVVAVLPDNNGVVIQVGDVGTADSLWILLHDHPAHVRVEKTLANAVGILSCIGVAVVGAVVSAPPADRSFNSSTTNSREPDLKREGCGVGLVSPQAMIASSDS